MLSPLPAGPFHRGTAPVSRAATDSATSSTPGTPRSPAPPRPRTRSRRDHDPEEQVLSGVDVVDEAGQQVAAAEAATGAAAALLPEAGVLLVCCSSWRGSSYPPWC
ncbi:hypothetical protein [Streptomyces thinghirensis]|uniref:hypothetical protein n=1 Tax=Streptomyces thinghirensis TaxID=551547 RepID=UPI0031EDB331